MGLREEGGPTGAQEMAHAGSLGDSAAVRASQVSIDAGGYFRYLVQIVGAGEEEWGEELYL